MDIETIQLSISIIGLFGIGGIIGAYLQHILEKRNLIGLEIRKITENRYRTTLIMMRIFLKPNAIEQFDLEGHNFPVKSSESEIKEYAFKRITEFYYNSLLYASDDVLICLKKFLQKPSEDTFVETAVAMRYDVWAINKRNKSDELLLEKPEG